MTQKKDPLPQKARRPLLGLLTQAIFVAVVFIIGLGFGVYYNPEITVFWNSIFRVQQAGPASTIAPAEALREDQSSIMLPQLEEPLPLIYSDTLDEPKVQEYLKQGAVVLPLGTAFGEEGNVVVTAHSSGTQSFGPYRFAFSKLAELKNGDEFTVQTDKAKYTYKVYGQDIVWPTQVDKLPQDNRSTVTLVTCWPLWTNYKRLLVHSELTKVEYR